MVSIDIFDQYHSTYMEELRIEAFSAEPLAGFINSLDSKDRDLLIKGKKYWLVAATYNWPQIESILRNIVQTCGYRPKSNMTALLSQAWKLIPEYLKLFPKFQPQFAPLIQISPVIRFMHPILTGVFGVITKQQLLRSVKLASPYFFSLDDGIVIVNPPKDMIQFGRLAAKSKAKMRCAILALEDALWPTIDIKGIIETITGNKGSRYYNITTDKFVNSGTAERMVRISCCHKVVAEEEDTNLFHHIVALLDEPDMLKPVQAIVTVEHTLIDSSSDEEFIIVEATNKTVKKPVKKTVKKEERKSDSEGTCSSDETPPKKLVKRRNIPSKIRNLTWRTYIGDSMDGRCWCCDDAISIEKWHAGHVLPASKGGPATVDNLRPLCAGCNLSMSNKHMADYIRAHDLRGKGAEEFGDTDDLVAKMAAIKL